MRTPGQVMLAQDLGGGTICCSSHPGQHTQLHPHTLRSTHLYALTVVEQNVAELLRHHVQVSLLALVGPCQNIELWKVRRQIIKRSKKEKQQKLLRNEKIPQWPLDTYTLTGWR